MGFTAGLYSYPKKKFEGPDIKTFSIKEVKALERYLDYENNEWAKNNYKTAVEYVERDGNKTDYIPTESDLAWARNAQITDEYGYKHLYKTIEDWCSGGAHFHDIFMKHCNNGVISRSGLDGIIKDIFQEIETCDFKPFIISSAFTYKEEDGEEYTKVFDIDGIRLYNEADNTYTDITTCDEGIITSNKYIESWSFGTYMLIFKALINLLSFDFDNNYLVYEGGW